MNARTVDYILLGLGVLISAKIYFSYIYPVIKQIIRIHHTPTGFINALPTVGQVEIVGKVEGKTFPSLFAQTACAVWRVEILEYAGGRGYLQTKATTSSEPFFVNDGTGVIQVFPAGAQLLISDTRDSTHRFPMEPQHIDVLKKIDLDTAGYEDRLSAFQIREHVIEPAEEIYILGEIEYRQGIKTVSTTEVSPMLISDRSQRSLLRKLYGDIALRLFLFVSFIFYFFGFINS